MSVCPYLFYTDAKAAKHWMFDICGFQPGILKEKEDGSIMHAEAHHGSSIIMFCAPNCPGGLGEPQLLTRSSYRIFGVIVTLKLRSQGFASALFADLLCCCEGEVCQN